MSPKVVLFGLLAVLGIQLYFGDDSRLVMFLGIAAVSFGIDYLFRHIPLFFVSATWLIGFLIHKLFGFQAEWWLWLSDFWTRILGFFLLPYLILIIPTLLAGFVIGSASGSSNSGIYRNSYQDNNARAHGIWPNSAN